jgi:hypothetical protein
MCVRDIETISGDSESRKPSVAFTWEAILVEGVLGDGT